GEMSSWYVLNAIGLYTYSPADPEYIITVPKFQNIEFSLDDTSFRIKRIGEGEEITQITYGGKTIDGYFITHEQLKQGNELVISTK
ncbi:glycoside hydrolase domain-containing protein, partial [Plebeiibacterium sediminum]